MNKKIVSLILLLSVVFTMIQPSVSAYAPPQVKFELDFDKKPQTYTSGDVSTGQQGFLQGTNIVCTILSADEAPQGSQGQVLKVTALSGASGAIGRNFGFNVDSQVIVEGRFYATDNTSGYLNFNVGVVGGAVQFILRRGAVAYNNGSGAVDFMNGTKRDPNSEYAINTWHTFKIVLDKKPASKTYDYIEYYLNGHLLPTGVPSYRTAGGTAVNNINISPVNSTFYFDDIKVTRDKIKIPLVEVQKPTWTGDILNWIPVANAASYDVTLRKDGKKIITQSVSNSESSYDFESIIKENGFGSYTASVKAIADPITDEDGPESEQSNINEKVNNLALLPKPIQPVWDGNTSIWQKVPGAVAYMVDLFKGSVKIRNLVVNDLSYDFGEVMSIKGQGVYKVKVKAIADVKLNRDSEYSDLSIANEFDPSATNQLPKDITDCIYAAKTLTVESITHQNPNEITENLQLPLLGINDTTIAWSSNHSDVVSSVGIVNSPAYGKDLIVILTATISKNTSSYEKRFNFVVKSLDPTYEQKENTENVSYKAYALSDDENNIFSDVPQGHWAKNYIEYLYKENIVKGLENGRFEPDRTISKEEVCTMLVNLLGLTGSSETDIFLDVQIGEWFYDSVMVAYHAGITKGVSATEFGVGQSITRQDLATLIVRTARIANIELTPTTQQTSFADETEISDYAKESVQALQMAGMMSGKGDGAFAPLGTATRAEVAKLVCMVYMLLK